MATPQEKLDRRLVKAAGRGDIPAMTALLGQGADINGHGRFWQMYMTPLGYAAWNKKDKAIAFLLARGANADKADRTGKTALMTAIKQECPKCVHELLSRGARLDDSHVSASVGRNPVSAVIARHKAKLEAAKKRAECEQLRARREKALEALEALKELREAAPPKENPDIVIFRQDLGGRVLEDVFNFASFERLTLVRAAGNGPVESMLRENFGDMQNRALLEKALAEHARRGGSVTEKDIFRDGKPKFSLPGGAP